MDITWHIVWKSAFIVLFGILMLRFSGRRSISQMTAATTVIMISIGNLLAQGILEKAVWRSAATVGLFLLYLMLLEYLEFKLPWFERLMTGRTTVVVREGTVDAKALRKLRITQHQLEMRLRQLGNLQISDLKSATIEVNGRIGYELMRHARPVTVGELEQMLQALKDSSKRP
ncbi:DUF421 domain-containing protein [Paenibacillus sambharensis]|uniref:DUF421 domain-containing protein n=1 Tax=Paenibacillus sambharensis TaxID=1803190 RepID=A0A2W1L8U3_9BACL|nr:YetF domain-containing protein [Paenibacillus sambharensis]PZD95333.1 DUF421 domain-containing protein [Paenibacillus sambharensis]